VSVGNRLPFAGALVVSGAFGLFSDPRLGLLLGACCVAVALLSGLERRLARRPAVGHRLQATLGLLARGKLLLFLVPLAVAVAGGLLWAMLAVVVAAGLSAVSLRPRAARAA
jgi:hypothetical protein